VARFVLAGAALAFVVILGLPAAGSLTRSR